MPVEAVFECHDEVTTYLLCMPFRQPGRGNAASEVLLLAEDVRPVERQFRFLLFEETPRQAHVPRHLVVRAFANIRPVAEGIGGIAPQLDAAGQVGVGVQPESVITGVIADFAQKVGGVAETPSRPSGRNRPIGAGSPRAGWHSANGCG